jgi:uncharacterized membrane protein
MIFVALGLITMLAFVGLTIDAAHAFVNHRQMQTAADAAALAGAYDVVHGNPASVASDANTYAHNNGYNGPNLHRCTAYPNVTDTNCWAYPYVDNTGKIHASSVEVRIHAGVTPFFAPFIHTDFINVHTRAVASLAAGQETPQYSFVALQSDGENHTLLVKNSSVLNVANSLYTDSCGGMPGCQGGGSNHDSFDVFGTGGTITDAKDIFVVGGWETHDGDFVGANGSTCLIGAGPYSPSVKTAVALTTGTASFKIAGPANGSAGPVNTNDVIQIENEQMLVTGRSGVGPNVILTVQRGYNSTTIATHAVNTVINKVGVVASNFNPSISTAAGGVNATDTTFNTSPAPTAVDPGDVIQINTEQMLVVSVGANSLTVQRGYNGTTAAIHAGGVVIQELAAPTSVFAPNGTPSGGHCPTVGQPYLPDPFALFPGPALGDPVSAQGPPAVISKINRVSGTATAVTSATNTLVAGDPINIVGVGNGFDGTYTVATANSTSFTYDNTAGSDGCVLTGCANTPIITGEKLVGGVATVTTDVPSTTALNDTVAISGLNAFYTAASAIVTAIGSSSFSYHPAPVQMNVTKKQLAGTTVTLTVSAIPAAFAAGQTVSVSGLGSPFNGSWTVTGVNGGAKTFTYTIPSPGPTTYSITKKAISGTTATLTTSPNNGVSAGDQITVNTSPTDARFDGTFAATGGGGAAGGTTLTYTIPTVTAAVTTKAAAAGSVTLTTSTTPFPFEATDTVSVAIGRLAYDGSPITLTGVSSGAGTFSYAAPTFQNTSWTWVAGTRTVTMTTASATGLRVGDTIVVTKFGGAQACLNQASVAVSAIGTNQFSYVIPGIGACTPGASGNQKGTFSLLTTAAATAATGTTTLTGFTSASGSFGTVTGPPFVALTSVTCTNCATITDVPATTANGTFSPAWMPAPGGVAANARGTPEFPSPKLINSAMNLSPGTYYGGICLGSANGVDCVGANCAVPASTTAYNPPVKVVAAVDATQVTVPIKWTGTVANPPDPVSAGDTIQIDSEQMAVTDVGTPTYSGAGLKNGATTLTVTRAVNGTTGATHATNAVVNKVLPPPSPITVNMAPGQYIMAGGGFHVCGTMSLNAPHVLIYSTNDPLSAIGSNPYSKVGQIEINTTGTVTLGPQTLDQDPLYAGFTIFEDRGQVVDPPTFNPTAYNPAQALASPGITSSDSFFTVNGTSGTIYPGNVISIGSELMMVTKVTNGSGSTVVTVTRGYDGTTPALHPVNTAVKSVTYGGDTCDSKAGKALGGDHTKMDISFLSAGNPPGGFPLDNISGTIYDAGPRADFENAMFGNANLAVISSCIFIDGGAVPPGLPAADFQFNPNGGNNIAGVTESLSE